MKEDAKPFNKPVDKGGSKVSPPARPMAGLPAIKQINSLPMPNSVTNQMQYMIIGLGEDDRLYYWQQANKCWMEY